VATERTKTSRPKRLELICYFCSGRLHSDDAHFEIYDQELPPFHSEHVRFNEHGARELHGTLAYPGIGESLTREGRWSGYERVALFTHTTCGHDRGYHFKFDRLGENWEQKLSEKGWWTPSIAEALTVARNGMNDGVPSALHNPSVLHTPLPDSDEP